MAATGRAGVTQDARRAIGTPTTLRSHAEVELQALEAVRSVFGGLANLMV